MSVLVADGHADVATRPVHDVLDFRTAPPGLLDLHEFRLSPLDETGHLFTLRSVEQPDIRLFLVPPRAYFPGYAPTLDAETRESLGLGDDDPVLLVVVRPGADGDAPTANLLAPVAINPTTGQALQVVLDGAAWPLRAPLTVADSAA